VRYAHRLRLLVFATLALGAWPACKSGSPPPPAVPPGPFAEAGKALVGQLRLFRFDGKKKAVQIKLQEVVSPSGPCEVAVEIRSASLHPGQAALTVDVVGQPRYEGQRRDPPGKKPSCRELPPQVSVAITTAAGNSSEKLTAEVGRVLLTPEGFLAAHGLKFDRPPAGAEPKEVADATLTASPDEQRIARAITAPQKRLLAVDPVVRAANKSIRQEGQVDLLVVVGADGRLYRPKVVTSIGDHEARLLKVLPLWRYEPARRGPDAVAVRLPEKAFLRLY
jgi:hypothetical protein